MRYRNVPTAMMIAESYNNVWGYTCNPYNRNCSSGGSSGGESALLALKGTYSSPTARTAYCHTNLSSRFTVGRRH